MVRWFGLAAAAAAVALVVGCGSGPVTVNGRVKVDGQPLKAGVVKFVPADGKAGAVTGDVKDGAFSVAVPPGEHKVEFTAPKPTGKKHKMYDTPDSPEVDEVGELLPAKYNVATELKFTATGGAQDAAFELFTK